MPESVEMRSESSVVLREVRKVYPPDVVAVANVSLEVPRGAHLALLGPSGCGKTTSLLLIAGLEAPNGGEVWIDDRLVAGRGTQVPPERRGVGLVFQDYALFPFLTVRQNVGFSLKRMSAPERARVVDELLDLIGLTGLAERYPHELSGGQQQRVALARALAPNPRVMLLDEPFSNLDAGLRRQVRAEVRAILKHRNVTTIFVTHDQAEALSAADLVGVMLDGKLEQIGSPEDVYRAPRTRRVAELVGEASFLTGVADGSTATCALGRLPLAAPATGPVTLMVRPESVTLEQAPDEVSADGTIEDREFYGHEVAIRVRLRSGEYVSARLEPRASLRPGDLVQVRIRDPLVALPPAPPVG